LARRTAIPPWNINSPASSLGEIALQMFHGGTLGSQLDAVEQVRPGGLEIGNFNLDPVGPIAAEANAAPGIHAGSDC